MILATTQVEDFDRFLGIFSTKGAEKRSEHGCKGARVFRRATAPHMRSIKRHFADALTPDQFTALADILRSLQNHLHPHLAARAEDGQR